MVEVILALATGAGFLGVVALGGWRRRERKQRAADARPATEPAPSLRSPGSADAATARFDGELRIKDVASFPHGLVVRGAIVVEDDSTLDGHVEVHGEVSLGRRARVTRPLVVHGNLVLGPDARVPSCEADGDVTLHPGARLDGRLACHALRLVEPAEPSVQVAAAAPFADVVTLTRAAPEAS